MLFGRGEEYGRLNALHLTSHHCEIQDPLRLLTAANRRVNVVFAQLRGRKPSKLSHDTLYNYRAKSVNWRTHIIVAVIDVLALAGEEPRLGLPASSSVQAPRPPRVQSPPAHVRPHRDLDGFLGRHSRPTRRGASKFILTQIGGAVGVGAAGGSPGSILPRRIKAPTTPAQNFRITDDGGKLRATCATWDDAVRGPSRQEGGMTREKAVDLVMNAQRGGCRRAGYWWCFQAGSLTERGRRARVTLSGPSDRHGTSTVGLAQARHPRRGVVVP